MGLPYPSHVNSILDFDFDLPECLSTNMESIDFKDICTEILNYPHVAFGNCSMPIDFFQGTRQKQHSPQAFLNRLAHPI
jgi:hypothetical protein